MDDRADRLTITLDSEGRVRPFDDGHSVTPALSRGPAVSHGFRQRDPGSGPG